MRSRISTRRARERCCRATGARASLGPRASRPLFFLAKPRSGQGARVPGMPSTIKRPRIQKGWNYRGYLPHFDADTVIQLITFRLADSLPEAIFNELASLASNDADLRQRVETMIDRGLGSCALREPLVAAVVRDALHHFDRARYRLIAWVIMPNHVHALIEQAGGFPLGDIVHAWKSFTAKQANKQLGRTGAFWARITSIASFAIRPISM